LLELRNRVFIVEQADPYPDLDGWDQKAMHLLGYDDKKLVAYSRLFMPGVKRAEATLGRICTASSHRRLGLGDVMIEKRLQFLSEKAPGCDVYTSLQTYRQPKYEALGFVAMGEPYLDGKILHIDMILKHPYSLHPMPDHVILNEGKQPGE
jgi:ElaA protein